MASYVFRAYLFLLDHLTLLLARFAIVTLAHLLLPLERLPSLVRSLSLARKVLLMARPLLLSCSVLLAHLSRLLDSAHLPSAAGHSNGNVLLSVAAFIQDWLVVVSAHSSFSCQLVALFSLAFPTV